MTDMHGYVACLHQLYIPTCLLVCYILFWLHTILFWESCCNTILSLRVSRPHHYDYVWLGVGESLPLGYR